ncbi:MAG TPA: DUF86 domain-containing protein [Terracidiphilus sp.]|nr:DUF86 domain-containing protein [Terracidiphilus sp.]
MNQHPLRARDYLGHMLDAVGQIECYLAGKTLAEFLEDRLLQDGVVRNIEVLGEASKRMLDAVPDAVIKLPGIPFTAIYAMRNQLSHGYFSIDLDLVWKVVEKDIPDLKLRLEAAIAAIDSAQT